jgi:hypothetical protein
MAARIATMSFANGPIECHMWTRLKDIWGSPAASTIA